MRHLGSAITTLFLITAAGCGDRENREVGGVTDTAVVPAAPAPEPEAPEARDYAFDQRQDFAASIRQQLDQLDQDIEELAAQAKSRGGAVSDRALANIRSARRSVDRSLQRVDAATEATWEDAKTRVNQAVENLSESIEVARPK
jgi:hypothetical protein